ncbi:hypothetical protein MERGE_000930 [Pneumocystis wakefieldiae]|uniref:Uncharacterized protein n=1 Tax=Pneumocystis wakefieldiae TaxID=38082 RepID=A0A899FRK9_9ASCO|nr:hypothetical protein MERGE_000930 [Pneumocystis wakefieldiae]
MKRTKKTKSKRDHYRFKEEGSDIEEEDKRDFSAKKAAKNDKKWRIYDAIDHDERIKHNEREKEENRAINEETEEENIREDSGIKKMGLLEIEQTKNINGVKNKIKEKKSKKELYQRKKELLKDRMKLPIWTGMNFIF